MIFEWFRRFLKVKLEYLRRNRCDEMQGFYFSEPVGADEFLEMLREDRTLDL